LQKQTITSEISTVTNMSDFRQDGKNVPSGRMEKLPMPKVKPPKPEPKHPADQALKNGGK